MKSTTDIFDKISDIVVSEAVKDALDNLEELKGISSVFNKNLREDFYNAIWKISGKSFSAKPDTLNSESLQTAKWALELWDDAAKAEKPGRMFVAYLILDYLGYPVDTLPIIWNNEKRKKISLKVTEGFNFDIGVSEDADYPHQSLFRQYREGVADNELGKLLEFFSTLKIGIGIDGRNPALPKLIQLIFAIHKDGILSLLNKDQPALAELTLQSLKANIIAALLADDYNEKHEFPLARGLVIVATHYREQLKQGDEDAIPYENMGVILEKLQTLPNWNTTFELLTSTATLKCNPVFHFCCGLCAGKSTAFVDQYTGTLEFSLEECDYGNSFYQALIRSGNDEAILHAAEVIYTKYCEYLQNYKGQYVLNRATSYFNIIAVYVHHNSQDSAGYQTLLAKQLDIVDAAKNSWFPHRAYVELQILYLFIAANFTLNFPVNVNAPIVKKIDAFIRDERHQGVLSDVPTDTLITLLTNPASIEALTVVYENGKSADLRRNPKDADTK